MAKSMKPGGGGRFAKLKKKVGSAKLAAWIGRRKYGAKKMSKWSAKGRSRAARRRQRRQAKRIRGK